MHVDAEPLPEHAARVANAAAVIDRKPDRDRMDDLAVAGLAQQIAVLEHPPHIGVGNLAPGDADLGPDDARRGETARQVRDDPLYRLAGHFLGGMHRVQNRSARRFEIDDLPVAHAARDLVPDPEHPRLVVLDPGDEAADLVRPDVERGDQAAARPDCRPARSRLACGTRDRLLLSVSWRGAALRRLRSCILRR